MDDRRTLRPETTSQKVFNGRPDDKRVVDHAILLKSGTCGTVIDGR